MSTTIKFQSEEVKKKYSIYYRVANYFRNKRFNLFIKLLAVKKDTTILDVGGTYGFWKELNKYTSVTLLNISNNKSDNRIKAITYNGADMPFSDDEFDVVFSNSTIEHVGNFWAQKRFADEVSRCGKKYFIQVPSFWFPYEPHAHIPLFQFFPAPIKIFLFKIIRKSTYPIEELLSIRLLTKAEIKILFP